MKCPQCGSSDLKVIDSRERDGEVRRRRQCFNRHRFTTIEHVGKETPLHDHPHERVEPCCLAVAKTYITTNGALRVKDRAA